MRKDIIVAFKETKGNRTVEACVMPAPGDMFKGYIRITTNRTNQIIQQTIGRGCGRPVPTAEAAMELAVAEAKRVIAL
jgi:hypothetical protein